MGAQKKGRSCDQPLKGSLNPRGVAKGSEETSDGVPGSPRNKGTLWGPACPCFWALGRPGIFLATAGDIAILPHVLAAGASYRQPVSNEEMRAQVERLAMAQLFEA